jgi:DNA-binding response OmpR family regulator
MGTTNVFNEVREVLARANFDYRRFSTEITLLCALRHEQFDLVLVDRDSVSDTDRDSEAVAQEATFYVWRNRHADIHPPVVLLSSAFDPRFMAQELDAGADDFINYPCDPDLFIARLRAVLRRAQQTARGRVLNVLGFTLDNRNQRLLDHGVPVTLTSREFALAWLFFSYRGKTLSRQFISIVVWGADADIALRSIEQHVHRLRKKLNLRPERGVNIRGVYTEGYCLELCEEMATGA